MNLSYRTLN